MQRSKRNSQQFQSRKLQKEEVQIEQRMSQKINKQQIQQLQYQKSDEIPQQQTQQQNGQVQQPQLNRKRAEIKQNVRSKLVQQKYCFSNLDQEQQQEYQSYQATNFAKEEQQQIQSQQRQVDFNDFISSKQVDQDSNIKLDENYNYTNVFLGKEGMFKDYKILIGLFYNYSSFITQTLGPELNRIGFKYDVVYDEQKFIDKCMDYDIAYVISNTNINANIETKFVEKIDQFMKASKSLFLWADNTPYTAHANCILSKLFKGMKLEGDYYGGQIVSVGDRHQKQKFDADHAIGYGLNNLHEGITICHPVNQHKDFENFAYNSNNEALVLYSEENENHGRIVIDMGFTKLYPEYWRNAGTHQYISNATVWLTGIVV